MRQLRASSTRRFALDAVEDCQLDSAAAGHAKGRLQACKKPRGVAEAAVSPSEERLQAWLRDVSRAPG